MQNDKQLLALADALDCFWNPAVNAIKIASYHGPASGADVIDAIANGLAAVASRLREHASYQTEEQLKPAAVPVEWEKREEYIASLEARQPVGVEPSGWEIYNEVGKYVTFVKTVALRDAHLHRGEGDLLPQWEARPVYTAPPAPAAVPVDVTEIINAFDDITGLCRHLRQGGPDADDLQCLSDGLEEAIDIAARMLARLSDPSGHPDKTANHPQLAAAKETS